jgi:hypothetical protein
VKSLLLFLLFVTTALAEPTARDGLYWKQLTDQQKLGWIIGWFDGMVSGAENCDQPAKLKPGTLIRETKAGTLEQGMDQFYAADYRNLPIWNSSAALFILHYSDKLGSVEATKKIEALRDQFTKFELN